MQVVIGRIGRAHGIRGELNVDIRTDEPERRFAPGSSVVCGDRTLTVASRPAPQRTPGRAFEEVPDRTAAEALHGTVIEAVVDPLDSRTIPTSSTTTSWSGSRRVTDDAVIGTVTGIVHGPHQDTLTVNIDGREVFIPFVTEIVPVVDVKRRLRDGQGDRGCSTRPRPRTPPRTWRSTDVQIDVVSIFPAYLDALQLSLAGKAQIAGLLQITTSRPA